MNLHGELEIKRRREESRIEIENNTVEVEKG